MGALSVRHDIQYIDLGVPSPTSRKARAASRVKSSLLAMPSLGAVGAQQPQKAVCVRPEQAHFHHRARATLSKSEMGGGVGEICLRRLRGDVQAEIGGIVPAEQRSLVIGRLNVLEDLGSTTSLRQDL
jgi:hypothetical protein